MDQMDKDIVKLANLIRSNDADLQAHWENILTTYGVVIARVMWKRAERMIGVN